MLKENPLFFPLKTQYFEDFKNGRKGAELRQYGKRWNEQTCSIGRAVTISKGYGTYERLQGRVSGFECLSYADLTDAEQRAVQAIWEGFSGKIARIHIEIGGGSCCR